MREWFLESNIQDTLDLWRQPDKPRTIFPKKRGDLPTRAQSPHLGGNSGADGDEQ